MQRSTQSPTTPRHSPIPSNESIMDFLRFQLSGIIGTLVFYIIYELINLLSVAAHPTMSWFFSYLFSIFFQFELHRLLVFGHWNQSNKSSSQQTMLPLEPVSNSKQPQHSSYWNQLLQCYMIYSISLILSTVLNYVMISIFGFPHRLTWFFSLVLCGIINYFSFKFVYHSNTTPNIINSESPYICLETKDLDTVKEEEEETIVAEALFQVEEETAATEEKKRTE